MTELTNAQLHQIREALRISAEYLPDNDDLTAVTAALDIVTKLLEVPAKVEAAPVAAKAKPGITVYEVYLIEQGFVIDEHLTEESADRHVANTDGRTAKRAVQIEKTEARITFNEQLIGKRTGWHSVAAARGGKIRQSYHKDVTKKVKITGLAWNGETLTGKAKVSDHMLTVERTLQSGWKVVSSERIQK